MADGGVVPAEGALLDGAAPVVAAADPHAAVVAPLLVGVLHRRPPLLPVADPGDWCSAKLNLIRGRGLAPRRRAHPVRRAAGDKPPPYPSKPLWSSISLFPSWKCCLVQLVTSAISRPQSGQIGIVRLLKIPARECTVFLGTPPNAGPWGRGMSPHPVYPTPSCSRPCAPGWDGCAPDFRAMVLRAGSCAPPPGCH